MEQRRLILEELSDFIDTTQQIIEDTLRSLGWDENNLKNVIHKTCPINPHHIIPEKALSKHIEVCRLKEEGYSMDSVFLPQSGDSSESCIILDEKTRSSVIHKAQNIHPEMKRSCDEECDSHRVPRTADRLFSSTTPDERLVLYDYVVEKTKHKHSEDLPLDLPFPDANESQKSEPKSIWEVRAQERDAKRRRMSYRRVHTSRKSHTEILREVIQNQMELLQTNVKAET